MPRGLSLAPPQKHESPLARGGFRIAGAGFEPEETNVVWPAARHLSILPFGTDFRFRLDAAPRRVRKKCIGAAYIVSYSKNELRPGVPPAMV